MSGEKLKYLILPNGNTYTLAKGTPQLKKPSVDRNGYYYYKFYINSKYKNIRRGRVVAQMYIYNPIDKPTVNHIDGNKQNDNINNLEWATYSENERHSYRVLGKKPNLTMLGKTGKKNTTSKPVMKMDTREVFESVSLAAQALGAKSHSAIALAARTDSKSCGSKWQYL